MWDDENYYLVAYDEEDSKIKHYRVDKMLHTSITQIPRKGQNAFARFEMPKYTKVYLVCLVEKKPSYNRSRQ